MSNSTFTPPPYLVHRHLVYALNEDGTNRISAFVQAGFVRQPRHGEREETTEDEAIATAHLFRAAPLLYEALRAQEHVEDCFDAFCRVLNMRDLKAENSDEFYRLRGDADLALTQAKLRAEELRKAALASAQPAPTEEVKGE